MAGFVNVLVLAASAAMCAEAAQPPINKIASDLFYRDPPGPNWAEVLNARIMAGEPMPAWPTSKAPDDDAQPAKHLAYWRCFGEDRKAPKPSPAARNQLLAAVLDDPTALGAVLCFLPETEDAARKLVGVLERLPAEPKENRNIHLQTRAWIYQNSGLMRDRVIEEARYADWKRYVYDERPDWALAAIQRREPELAAGSEPGLATMAARLLLEKADAKTAPKWREQLESAAANETFPEEAREIAVHALLKAKWSGRRICSHDVRASAATLQPLLPWLDDSGWGGKQPYQARRDLFRGTYSGESPKTEILRFETGNSTRRSIQTIKGIDFDGSAMWVDDAEGTIHAAANGDLVRVPLKPAGDPPRPQK